MSASPIEIDPPRHAHPWVVRVRVLLIATIVWCGLFYLAGPLLRDGAVSRPVLLTGVAGFSAATFAGFALAALALAIGIALFALLGVRNSLEPLVALAIAMAVWVAPGGTMDHFLVERLPTNGIPAGPVYWSLLYDYVALALLAAAILAFTSDPRRARRATAAPPAKSKSAKTDAPAAIAGAVAITSVVALVVLWILGGERLGPTLRGQVFFATFAAFMAGAYVSGLLVELAEPRNVRLLFFAPIVAGVIGAAYTAIFGKLPPPYDQLNNIQLTPLVRALPLEMVALGWLGIASTLHLRAAAAAEAK